MCIRDSFTNAHWDYGSPRLERFNGVSAMEINGQAGAAAYRFGDFFADDPILAAHSVRDLRIARRLGR